jgi:hypothetical protein
MVSIPRSKGPFLALHLLEEKGRNNNGISVA